MNKHSFKLMNEALSLRLRRIWEFRDNPAISIKALWRRNVSLSDCDEEQN